MDTWLNPLSQIGVNGMDPGWVGDSERKVIDGSVRGCEWLLLSMGHGGSWTPRVSLLTAESSADSPAPFAQSLHQLCSPGTSPAVKLQGEQPCLALLG